MCASGKPMSATKTFTNNLETLYKALSANKKAGTELHDLYNKTKDNMMLAYLSSRQTLNSQTHFNT